jgi:hypothetical protein
MCVIVDIVPVSTEQPRKCGMVVVQHRMVGFKVLRSFYANCGYNVQTTTDCKTDRSAVLMVMSAWTLT